MRTLLALRHAKAGGVVPGAADADRALTSRGRDDARQVARVLRGTGPAPALVLCSPALRARQTLDEIAAALPADVRISVEDGLYLAGCGRLLERVRLVGPDVPSLLVVGHNPGLHELVRALARPGRASAQERHRLPTAALAVLDLPVDSWSRVEPGCGELISCVTPRRRA